ncbi:MAG: glycogen debranching protein GlgX, partial [Gemmatimonadaceae bacterium]
KQGKQNYWGYDTIGYFAPHNRYSHSGDTGEQVQEFRQMVRDLHAAGIEVILDVVYNHTGEGNENGPTLCFRGLDNAAYYRLLDDDPRYYMDYTGTGNSLNVRNPNTLQLIMDSLRYWVTEMHVDGFRFDLASALARELHDVDKLSAFFDIIHQDPTLAGVKLIAEPWDVGPGGYQVGNFPIRWAEWNGRYRDTIRHFWRGDDGCVPEMASRLAGSSDIYQSSGRGAYASINFVTAHDGYTLYDLVSYARKHNEENGEENRDGTNDNISRNWGVEGDTKDEAIIDDRFRQMRDFIATLAFSQGVPMLSHGDEIARTQLGNNNAYAQDNETSWVNWELSDRQKQLLAFTRKCFNLRHSHAVLRRRHFFRGEPTVKDGAKDLSWIRSDGRELTAVDWGEWSNHTLGMLIWGDATDETDDRGRPIVGETLLLVFNGSAEPVRFTLPTVEGDGIWAELVDTAHRELHVVGSGVVELAAFSLVMLRYGENRRMASDTPRR